MMLEFRPRMWGALSAALLGAACGEGQVAGEQGSAAQHGEAGEAAAGEAGGEHGAAHGAGGEAGEGGAAAANLGPAEQRAFAVAQMRGHFHVARALAEAGDAKAASPHFGHPLYEVFQGQNAAFAGAVLDPKPFETLNQAAAAGQAAAALAAHYAAAEAAITALEPQGPLDRAAVVKALLALAHAEYAEGVQNGAVVNAVEYQDAFGFAQTAAELIGRLEGAADARAEAQAEAKRLAEMVPGPLPPKNPAPAAALLAQISRIELALAGL